MRAPRPLFRFFYILLLLTLVNDILFYIFRTPPLWGEESYDTKMERNLRRFSIVMSIILSIYKLILIVLFWHSHVNFYELIQPIKEQMFRQEKINRRRMYDRFNRRNRMRYNPNDPYDMNRNSGYGPQQRSGASPGSGRDSSGASPGSGRDSSGAFQPQNNPEQHNKRQDPSKSNQESQGTNERKEGVIEIKQTTLEVITLEKANGGNLK